MHPTLPCQAISRRSPVRRLTAALLSGLLVTAPSWGENKEYGELSLKELLAMEVFTAASLLPTQASKAPGTVYSFSHRDFARLGVRSIEDLLAFVPGLQLNQYRKRHQAIWARGLVDRYNDKLVLLVDGVRRQHLYYGHFRAGDNLPLENIAKVEIILGPASSLYGANAFAGMISVTTRDFSAQDKLEVSLEAADNNRTKGTLSYNSAHVQAFASGLSQDAPFRDARRSFIGGAVEQPPDEDYSNLFVKARPIEGLTLSLDYRENKTPFLFIPNSQDAFIDTRNITTAAAYQMGNLDSGEVTLRAFHSSDDTMEFERERHSQRLGYRENQHATMAGLAVTGMKALADHVIALGFDWQQEQAKDTHYTRYFHFREGFLAIPRQGDLLSDPRQQNDNHAVFVQDVWKLAPNLEWTLGARYDDFERFDGKFNYRTALVHTPDQQQTWKLLYGTAIRSPTLREYLKVLEGTSFAAPIPDPEEVATLELGYLYQWERANVSVNLFSNALKNFILEMPTPDGADEFFANAEGTIHTRGIESVANFQATSAWNLRLAAGYVNVDAPSLDNIPYIANWTGSLATDYRISDRLVLGLALGYNGDRGDTNRFADDNPGDALETNIFANGRLTPALTYSLGIDNVFDQRIYDPASDFGGQYNTERAVREIWLRLQWNYDL